MQTCQSQIRLRVIPTTTEPIRSNHQTFNSNKIYHANIYVHHTNGSKTQGRELNTNYFTELFKMADTSGIGRAYSVISPLTSKLKQNVIEHRAMTGSFFTDLVYIFFLCTD